VGLRVVKAARRRYDALMQKECPMCGEFMKLHLRETVSRVPGTSQEIRTPVREWVCPECDYFEEAESGDTEEG
jgi:C4-type Zn-finger protein